MKLVIHKTSLKNLNRLCKFYNSNNFAANYDIGKTFGAFINMIYNKDYAHAFIWVNTNKKDHREYLRHELTHTIRFFKHANGESITSIKWMHDKNRYVRYFGYLIEEFYAILCGELRIRKRNENFFKYTVWFITKISKVVVKYFKFTKDKK